ncbi:hypothetical protein HNQ62_002673 [Sulfurisphaera ohwakuensis]|uniref:Uncharacterized protein n=1 Tax=Sulfurisphaera ohwakuensis TaxID=69656 RepID=A0A7J9RXV8_SULOH|nr:hypothetical protein [Sulfurisphaera ohwakuensis]
MLGLLLFWLRCIGRGGVLRMLFVLLRSLGLGLGLVMLGRS